jgi:hypothetical protein
VHSTICCPWSHRAKASHAASAIVKSRSQRRSCAAGYAAMACARNATKAKSAQYNSPTCGMSTHFVHGVSLSELLKRNLLRCTLGGPIAPAARAQSHVAVHLGTVSLWRNLHVDSSSLLNRFDHHTHVVARGGARARGEEQASAPARGTHALVCRGARARVTISRCRDLALQTFRGTWASSNIFSNRRWITRRRSARAGSPSARRAPSWRGSSAR